MLSVVSSMLVYTDRVNHAEPRVCKCSRTLEQMASTLITIFFEALAIVQIVVLFPLQCVGKGICGVACWLAPESKSCQDLYKKFPDDLVFQIGKVVCLVIGILACTISFLTLAQFADKNLALHRELCLVNT